MGEAKPPSRALLMVAGALTQLIGAASLVLALASLPVVHDLHSGTHTVIASVVASIAAIVCGTLVWRGHLVPLALAIGLDVGFGIVLPRGGSAIGALLRILPADDAATADTLVTVGAVAMFVAAAMCLIAVPAALRVRAWLRDGGAAKAPDTLKGVGVKTVMLRTAPARSKPAVIAGVAVTVTALGIAGIMVATEKPGTAPAAAHGAGAAAGSARPVVQAIAAPAMDGGAVAAAGDAAVAVPSVLSFDDFVASWHQALANGDVAGLLDAKAFAFGVEAHDVAEGRDAVAALLVKTLAGAKVEPRFQQLAHDGDVGWLAEELRAGSKTYVVTAVAGATATGWTIAAVHWALAMPNTDAYRLARDGDLAVPDAIPDTHDTSPLAQAMRTAFASKPSFVDARSTRGDAFNFGSAPGERITGGDAIKKTFARIRAVIHLHDAVKVGTVGTRGGWGAANVDFTDADRDGTDVTQTFRVLAAWIQEDAGWRIVQTQWSNAR